MEALRFAATKIQPPRQWVARVERPQLDAAVRQALLTHRVLLLQAAAGFGKTSTLAAQLAHPGSAGEAWAWVSLDEDDDAERLFACLVAALERFDLPWRTAPEALVEMAGGDAASRKRAATELINALAGAEVPRGVIVLDDLHRVHAAPNAAPTFAPTFAPIYALLDALIERLPERWTLVLASRTVPPLALARLRAQGALAEFNQDDLRFSPEEAGTLLQHGAAPAALRHDLYARTGGWPAGLRLALAAFGTRGTHGTRGTSAAPAAGDLHLVDRHLFDYLASEVLDDMPVPLHDFLLRCAVLPELTAARTAAVSGDRRAAEWLQEIERRGLFVTALDAQERTLVLHDLFREALLQRLRERLPEELPVLLKRAAAGEDDPLRRVGFLVRAGDWPAAEAALAEAASELFLQGGAGDVLRLVEQFPPAQRTARLLRLAGAASGLRWQWNDMARWLAQALQAAQAAGDLAEAQRAQARLAYALYPLDRNDEAVALITDLQTQTQTPTARALLLFADTMQQFRRGQHHRLPALYGEVLDILEAGESLFRWWECTPPYNWSTIAGMPALIERYLAGVLPRLGERPLPLRGELHLLRAVGLLWTGELPAAEAAMAATEDDIRWLAVSGEVQVGNELLRCIAAAMQGRADELSRRLDALLQREDGRPAERRRLWRHQMAIYGVRLSDTVGDEAGLRRFAALLKENPLADASAQNPRALAARARHAAATQRWAEAVALFELLAPRLPGLDVMGQRTDLTLRHAHALLRGGRIADAAHMAAPVLDRLRAEQVRGQALLCGPAVLQALTEARFGPLLTAGQRAELAAVAQLSAALHGGAVAPSSAQRAADDDGLSQREREVLLRIAAGDSNKLIARALDISPHTVKRHVANILDKLGLGSRGQAAAWLREHG